MTSQYCLAIALFGALAFLCGYVVGHEHGHEQTVAELRPVLVETRERLELVNGLLGPLECRTSEAELQREELKRRFVVLPGVGRETP